MDIFDKIDSALSTVFESYYRYMPEFEEGAEPEIYAVYNCRWHDTQYASGKAETRQYYVSVSVFSPSEDLSLYDKTQAAMESIDAISTFSGVTDLSQSGVYPNKKMIVMDFIVYEERN